jgi:hypothetical protein
MKHMAASVLCLLPLAGCSGWIVLISPTGVSCTSSMVVVQSPTTPPSLRRITVGETVHGTLSACHLADEFHVAVVADGSLVVRVGWNVAVGNTLLVSVNGTEFRSPSPVVARVPAARGRDYLLRVAAQGAAEIPDYTYQLTTSLE